MNVFEDKKKRNEESRKGNLENLRFVQIKICRITSLLKEYNVHSNLQRFRW